MIIIYSYEFGQLKNFSLSDVSEVSGQIVEAVLNIESRGDKHELKLKNPKVPSARLTTVRDLFSYLTPESVGSFKVFGEQYGSSVLWRIEMWKDGTLKDCTIRCNNIQGLPPEKNKLGLNQYNVNIPRNGAGGK